VEASTGVGSDFTESDVAPAAVGTESWSVSSVFTTDTSGTSDAFSSIHSAVADAGISTAVLALGTEAFDEFIVAVVLAAAVVVDVELLES